MAKLNGIGIPAQDVDRIIDRAIQLIGTSAHKYSCCALTPVGDTIQGWKVRKAYTRTFGPVTSYIDNYGYALSMEVSRATYGTPREARNLRVFMLSLFRAAWRDLT